MGQLLNMMMEGQSPKWQQRQKQQKQEPSKPKRAGRGLSLLCEVLRSGKKPLLRIGEATIVRGRVGVQVLLATTSRF
eukprot:4181926-Amphidinium_carterae.1